MRLFPLLVQIRGIAAMVLEICSQRLRADDWRELGVVDLLAIAGKLVSDNTPEARNAAKKLIAILRSVHSQQVCFVFRDDYFSSGSHKTMGDSSLTAATTSAPR